MLKFLRTKERAKKIIFWILLSLMILAFVLWGAGSYKESAKASDYRGSIFGRRVSSQEFQRIYLSCLNDAKLRFGEAYTQILPLIDLNNQTWVKLILLEHAQKQKIRVSNQEVIRDIADSPAFQKDDKFNPEMYKRIVRYYLNLKPREFEEQTRDNLILRKLFIQTTKDITALEEEVLGAYKRDFEKVEINYLKLEAKDFLPAIQINEEQLKEYFQKNSMQFREPPAVRVEYLGLDYPPEAKDEDREKILKDLDHSYPIIKNAQDFKNITLKDYIHRQSGFFSREETVDDIYSEEFYKYAFSLKENQASPIIDTSKGAYVLKVIQKRDTYTPALEEIKTKVEAALKLEKAKEEARKKIEEYRNNINESLNKKTASDLKEAVKPLNLQVKSTAEFKRGEPIPDIGMAEEIINAAFNLKTGEISPVLAYQDNFFLISQEKFTPIDEAKFKEEKEKYREDLLEKKKQNAFNSLQAQLISQANLTEK